MIISEMSASRWCIVYTMWLEVKTSGVGTRESAATAGSVVVVVGWECALKCSGALGSSWLLELVLQERVKYGYSSNYIVPAEPLGCAAAGAEGSPESSERRVDVPFPSVRVRVNTESTYVGYSSIWAN